LPGCPALKAARDRRCGPMAPCIALTGGAGSFFMVGATLTSGASG